MKEVLLEKVGADDPLQAAKDFGVQLMNYFRECRQLLRNFITN